MKKFIAMFTAVLSLLLLSVPVTAAQGQNGNIGTTVPTEHSVSIEAEHAFALYTEGSKGQSAAYLVPRFSEPHRPGHRWSVKAVFRKSRCDDHNRDGGRYKRAGEAGQFR